MIIGKHLSREFSETIVTFKHANMATALLLVTIVRRILVLMVIEYLELNHLNMVSLGSQKLFLVAKGHAAT